MAVWRKVPAAVEAWAPDINPKLLYDAIRKGKCRAARVGAGRNLLVCEAFVDEWLRNSAERHREQD